MLEIWQIEVEIDDKEYMMIRNIISQEKNLVQIRENCWAPKRYQSWFWKSSWICMHLRSGSTIMSARMRDYRIIMRKYINYAK